MDIQRIQQQLKAEGISATQAEIRAELSQVDIALSEVDEEVLSHVVELFRGKTGGLARTDGATDFATSSQGSRRKKALTVPTVPLEEIRSDRRTATEAENQAIARSVEGMLEDLNLLDGSVEEITAAFAAQRAERILRMSESATAKTAALLGENSDFFRPSDNTEFVATQVALVRAFGREKDES